MIFKNTWQKVLDGTKTQTRRLIKSPECPYKIGRVYAIQKGRGKNAIGYILVKNIWVEYLMNISVHDCIQEGIEILGEVEGCHVPEYRERFADLWDSLYNDPGLKFNSNPEVWVIEFELIFATANN